MNVVILSGSTVGSKTKLAMELVSRKVAALYPEAEITFIDLAQKQLVFSDGRNYFEYEGDTKFVTESIMRAEAIIIGTPIFQASIPGSLKNVFDLLPVDALREKVVSIVVTAGSAKHYLIVEQQLKPILSYMKAHIVPTYVFIEEADFLRTDIINDDVHFRMDRLVEDTMYTIEALDIIREKQDAAYDF